MARHQSRRLAADRNGRACGQHAARIPQPSTSLALGGLIVGVSVPVVEWLAYAFLTQKPERAQIYESFLAFLPGIAGAYGGADGTRGGG